jgi:hypothetical protein
MSVTPLILYSNVIVKILLLLLFDSLLSETRIYMALKLVKLII